MQRIFIILATSVFSIGNALAECQPKFTYYASDSGEMNWAEIGADSIKIFDTGIKKRYVISDSSTTTDGPNLVLTFAHRGGNDFSSEMDRTFGLMSAKVQGALALESRIHNNYEWQTNLFDLEAGVTSPFAASLNNHSNLKEIDLMRSWLLTGLRQRNIDVEELKELIKQKDSLRKFGETDPVESIFSSEFFLWSKEFSHRAPTAPPTVPMPSEILLESTPKPEKSIKTGIFYEVLCFPLKEELIDE